MQDHDFRIISKDKVTGQTVMQSTLHLMSPKDCELRIGIGIDDKHGKPVHHMDSLQTDSGRIYRVEYSTDEAQFILILCGCEDGSIPMNELALHPRHARNMSVTGYLFIRS